MAQVQGRGCQPLFFDSTSTFATISTPVTGLLVLEERVPSQSGPPGRESPCRHRGNPRDPLLRRIIPPGSCRVPSRAGPQAPRVFLILPSRSSPETASPRRRLRGRRERQRSSA
jgi:hypothetical protein